MQIFLASDHAGFFLKEKVKEDLKNRGFLVEDFGASQFNEADNYPDFILPCVQKYISKTNGDIKRGIAIIFGGSGTGEAILANKVRGAKTVVFNGNSLEIVKLGRAHNNANVLSIGARFVKEEDATEAIKVFMSTPFEGGRHAKRVLALDML
jgi:ribose 5-phosphate isomerase B